MPIFYVFMVAVVHRRDNLRSSSMLNKSPLGPFSSSLWINISSPIDKRPHSPTTNPQKNNLLNDETEMNDLDLLHCPTRDGVLERDLRVTTFYTSRNAAAF